MEVKNFEVEINMPERYDSNVYTDGENCYLAQALKKMFPEAKIDVSCVGISKIDGNEFTPSEKTPFDSMVCIDNVGKQFKIKMELSTKPEKIVKYKKPESSKKQLVIGVDPAKPDNIIIIQNE